MPGEERQSLLAASLLAGSVCPGLAFNAITAIDETIAIRIMSFKFLDVRRSNMSRSSHPLPAPPSHFDLIPGDQTDLRFGPQLATNESNRKRFVISVSGCFQTGGKTPRRAPKPFNSPKTLRMHRTYGLSRLDGSRWGTHPGHAATCA